MSSTHARWKSVRSPQSLGRSMPYHLSRRRRRPLTSCSSSSYPDRNWFVFLAVLVPRYRCAFPISRHVTHALVQSSLSAISLSSFTFPGFTLFFSLRSLNFHCLRYCQNTFGCIMVTLPIELSLIIFRNVYVSWCGSSIYRP